ncbi:Vacuolar protein sorting-associated protein 11-like protein [Colletotrichum siamense]|nr:Vacuolar protein sorting-associated protein 11-like protein [Colletotrichum siamense]
MSIKPLPEDVIRRIRSSATITSLNAVVCGLIKNSFDAGATRINITVDYSRGNCTVQDDGLGILPIEFREAGGLGKLYHTSRHSPENEAHGANGNFLASLAALSLLSITSHHHLHNSQNSLTLHNAKVLARNVPALPEQRLLAFAHGTRVIVRDLFGSMAVRVKQRAVASEKAAVDKEWSRLVHDLAALLLAWPTPVALYARDTINNNEIRFKPTSTSSLSGGLDHVSWIPIGATRGKLTIDGCISLSPVATRRAQFISFGVHPVDNEHGTNVLYTEVNRVFVNSGFAIEEDVDMSLDQDELLESLKGLANRNVRPKRGLDRWPMFHFRISSSSGVRPLLTSSFEDLLEERNRTLSDMIGLLKLAALSDQASSSESSSEEAGQYTATETELAESAQPQEVSQDSSQFPNVNYPFTSAFQRFKENSAQPAREPSDWFKGVLSKWENPVFEPVQPSVPRVDDTSLGGGDEDVGSTQATDAGCCHHTSMSNIKLTGRISKAALAGAEVVSQVDAKFILVKLHREQVSGRARPELQRNSVLVLVDQHAADERCRLETLMQNYFEKVDGSDEVVARTQALDKPLQFEFSNKEHLLLRRYAHHLRRWGIFYMLGDQESNEWRHKSRQLLKVEVLSLPPSIYERCKTDPKLLAEVLRNEIWKLEEEGRPTTRPFTAAKDIAGGDIDWVSNFHGCPQGILDLLHSRSCRSAIMFNDILSKDECKSLVRRLAASLEREAPTSTDTQRRPQHNSHRRPSDEPLTPRDVAMAFQWKAFDFFDVAQVRLADDETRAFFESNEIASVCSGSDSLFLGSYDGFVRIVGSSWKIVKSFQAHDVGTITHMRQIEGTSLLVTVAEDLSSEPVLKIWALDKLVKKTNMPTCLSTLNITNNKKQFPISAIDLLDNLTQVAVGFANGAVTLIRGDLINDLGAKQRTVHESEEPVTGIELMTDVQGVTTLFISTTARILKLAISRRGHSSPPKTVEDLGCNVDCMTVDKRTGDVVVAREDAIYTYTLEGRGAPRAYESPKRLVSIYQDYVALICPPSSPTTDKPSDTMRRRFGGGAADALFNASTFVLLEPDLRVIGHTQSLISPFKAIFQIWGDLFVLTQDGKVNRFHEKTLQQRLEMLYQRNMFPLAIELAQKSKMDATQQSGIFRRFGDHLYQKADYDGAMVQYIKAIDTTEPSQVIRKFLDTQRIHNLIQYLEQLHEHRKATADHTTLLLNCYAKLKDIDKLEAFIKSPGDLKFDLETAISMCRQGGYYEQAAYLAKKHGETDLVVDILIEDSKKYADALDFIWRQDPEVAYPCLKKYARVLIENCPKDATTLFIDYYTGKYRPRIHIIPIEDNEESVAAGGYVAGAANAVQNLSNFLPLPYMNTSSIASPSTPGNQTKPINGDASLIMNPEDIPAPKYSPPRPRTAFSSFIDHPDEFIVFLEACLKEPALEENDRTDLYTTLFEMYLHKSNEKKGDQHKEEWENKAKTLIEGQDIPMESSNVLLLSHLSDFKDGTTLVKEQSGLLFDIFRSYTSAKDTRGAIKALRKYGPEEPQLYPAALAYLTSDPRILEEAGPVELSNVLGKIDRDGLMAPLQVIQTLVGQNGSSAGGGVATMGMIKPYLHETIDRERKEIAANRRRITAFRSETEHKRAELAELGSKPAVFQSSRCSVCTAQLDLPAVHFLCKHSFHQRCLRVEGECPQCATDNATIRALRKTQIETAGKHELFKAELERSEDRFGTVAEWFGRGVMGAPNADTT